MPLTPKMVAAKTKEIDALIASIEDKTTAIGELGVQIVSMKEDLSDCEVTLLEDKKFLADLEKNCLKQSTLDAAGIASFLDQLVAVKTKKIDALTSSIDVRLHVCARMTTCTHARNQASMHACLHVSCTLVCMPHDQC